MDIYVHMGKKLRAARYLAGLTQARLAERADISISFLGHIERGTRKMSIETMIQLCVALGIHPARLMEGLMPFPYARPSSTCPILGEKGDVALCLENRARIRRAAHLIDQALGEPND